MPKKRSGRENVREPLPSHHFQLLIYVRLGNDNHCVGGIVTCEQTLALIHYEYHSNTFPTKKPVDDPCEPRDDPD